MVVVMKLLYKFYFDIKYENTMKNCVLKYSLIVIFLLLIITLSNTLKVFLSANKSKTTKSAFCISNVPDYLWEKEGVKNIIFDSRTGWKSLKIENVEIGCQVDDGKDNIGSVVLEKIPDPRTVFTYTVNDVVFQVILDGKAIDYYIYKNVDGLLRISQSGMLPDEELDKYFQENNYLISVDEVNQHINNVMNRYCYIVQKLYRKMIVVFLLKRIFVLLVLLQICRKIKIHIYNIVKLEENKLCVF